MKVLFVELSSGDTLLRKSNPMHIPSIGDFVYIPDVDKIFKVDVKEFHYSSGDEDDTVLIWLKESL